ncbi:hypothetical protein DXG03_007574 [Asterophora parasitica]|uniref:tRNA-guanine(15) transglycosylase-like domain-containing protein n=1 Tax=Asterophora parasitica TaxID=117018 RepID=A0A9P7GCN8_9AGAR|nr:hypothetical protein DXG03_007574 [Asterophora parasitica]
MDTKSTSRPLTFSLSSSADSSKFGPRTGTLVVSRQGEGKSVDIDTPALLTLEQDPPLPTLPLSATAPNANAHRLHRHLGLDPSAHLVSLVLRDPYDTRDIPTNGKDFVSALCLRGVRKPDIVLALADEPTPSHSVNQGQRTGISQKRLTKSVERGREWLAQLLAAVSRSHAAPAAPTAIPPTTHTPGIFVSLVGSNSPAARMAFARSLLEPLSELETATLGGLKVLDEGVSGYVVDLVALRRGLAPTPIPASASETSAATAQSILSTASSATPSSPPIPSPRIHEHEHALLHASLGPLSATKPRLVTGTNGPHDILRLVRDVGVDGVDAGWAVQAGGRGVALEFGFPAPVAIGSSTENGKQDIEKQLGHNLYDVKYALDLRPLSGEEGVCACIACKPVPVPGEKRIVHSEVDVPQRDGDGATRDGERGGKAPYTRAYIHHLLHTHEMSAHALLVAHNLATAGRFLEGVRRVLDSPSGGEIAVDEEDPRQRNFEEEIQRFEAAYAELDEEGVMSEAEVMWATVERARGKGRLGREREKAELKGASV